MNKRAETVLEFDKIKNILSEYAISPMAKQMIHNLEPCSDESLVKKMQQETTEGVNILNSGIHLPLEGIRDIRNSLRFAKLGSVLSPKDLLDIASTMRTSRLIKTLWAEKKLEFCRIFDEIIDGLHTFQSIEEKIERVILGEDEIADNASIKLSAIRRQKRVLTQRVKEKLESIVNSPQYQKALQEPIVTLRKDRYVIPVKQEFKGAIPGVVHDQSSSGSTLYVEPMPVLQMNNELRQLETQEKKEIERILWEFTLKIQENHDFLSDTLDRLVRVDFIMSKACYSVDINGVEPQLNNKGYINIIKGRHPLLKGDVVPIDVFLGDEFTILVITGPNTGGKTVSLKTVGLMTLMSQSGLHVPAEEGTQLAVFDEVFADIGDEQSIEQSLSTFSSHLKNIKEIIEKASNNCLVLLDELGAGTDPTEGAALAMAILTYFYEKGSRVIATTHYSELKAFAYSTEGIENASVEFDVKTLSPTYRLTIGIPGKSNAFEIARRLGIKQEIVDSARGLLATENLKMEELLKHIEQEKNKAEEEKEEVNSLRRQYLKKLEKLEEEKEKILQEQQRILEKARQKARNILEKVESEADQIIARLKEAEEKDAKHIRDRAIENTRAWLRETGKFLKDSDSQILKAAQQKSDEPLKPGDRVKIAGLNQEGHIISIDEAAKSAQIQVGIMKISVPLKSLIKTVEEKLEDQRSRYASIAVEKAKNVSNQIDLRGLTLDEALLKVDKYLDDAYIAGLPIVYLIHGKGTGILRQGIAEMLRKKSEVKHFRPGNMDEGGLGVTVVEFK
ncbi:MAG TPA: endonuclease MutS2 [Thermoanaerobacterales bacterium]|nr:endonuclease MutS2 [Thermoanaerobacterales bacterium]